MNNINKIKIDLNSNIEKYLTAGNRTTIGENVKKVAECINGKDSIDTIRQIMYIMNSKIPMERNHYSVKKFKRSADEIIQDKSRTGCCDSSTLFVSLCKATGIPACQIITANMDALNQGITSYGHFFSGCYLLEDNKWIWLNSDAKLENLKDLKIHMLDFHSEFLIDDFYIFAVEKDYSDFELNGLKIDSIESINKIHQKVYENYLNDFER